MTGRRLLVATLLAAATAAARAAAPDLGSDAQRASGQKLYVKFCAQCHGEKGDGEGYAAAHLDPLPRNFTTGKFKIRTTPNGAVPTTKDLENIIRRGMPYTSMPAWPSFKDEELSDLAYYLKSFSADFANAEYNQDPVPLAADPGASKDTIEQGQKIYVDAGCVRCHGNLGRGDGPSAPTLVDDWGQRIRAADLTQSWTFRGGGSREDIFRTLATGLNGTPMPSFLDALKPEEVWALADFIVSLSGGGRGPQYANLLLVQHVPDPIELEKGAAAFASAPVARFPIVGQITEPGRSFHPPVTSILVQAVYDAENIAFLVRWNDMREDRGKNGPELPVPLEEEGKRDGAPAAAGESAGGDVWGEEAAAPASEGEDVWGEESAAPSAPSSEFSDAVALQLPLQLPSDARKPYFIFGDAQNPVDLWFFDLARPEPCQYLGKGSADVTPNDTGDVTATAKYDQGEWSVIFKRALRPSAGVPFNQGQFVPLALSMWDGTTRERGNRRGLTVWYHLYLAPEVVASPVGSMTKTALLVLAVELVAIFWARKRYGPPKERTSRSHDMQQSSL